MLRTKLDSENIAHFKDEILLMTEITHPNLVTFIKATFEPPNLCLLLEYEPNGALDDILKKKKGDEEFSWLFPKLKMALDIARGMVQQARAQLDYPANSHAPLALGVPAWHGHRTPRPQGRKRAGDG